MRQTQHGSINRISSYVRGGAVPSIEVLCTSGTARFSQSMFVIRQGRYGSVNRSSIYVTDGTVPLIEFLHTSETAQFRQSKFYVRQTARFRQSKLFIRQRPHDSVNRNCSYVRDGTIPSIEIVHTSQMTRFH